MSKDISWAERTSWTEDDRLDFYRRLSRARKRNRASLIIRQGAVLATSAWPDGNHIALALLAEAEKHGLDEWTRAGF